MQISIKKNNETIYKDLNVGDVFMFGTQVYMVTDQPENNNKKDDLKSVNLSNGNMEIFGSKVTVRKFENAVCTLE